MIYPITNQILHTQRSLDGINEVENLAGMIRTGSPLYVVKECMDGSREAIYHVNLVYLLDNVFTKNSTKYLSIEQERYLAKFFQEAGKVNDKINEDTANVDPYENMDDIMRQLDNFLGSYFGVDYGRFAR